MNDHTAIKSLLESKLATLVQRSEEIREALRSPGEKDSEENALAIENDEALDAIGQSTDAEIAEIQQALLSIASGSYGTCKLCQKSISKERLDAVPWATRCIHCA